MDLSMELGLDFVEQINAAVGSCRLLVAVVGPHWTSIEDSRGTRRLDDPADFNRVEIEAGLRQADVRVVPVLVQGAAMPSADELPGSLAGFARRHALELSDARWRYDVDRLVATAERVLESGPSVEPEPSERREVARGHRAASGPADDRTGPATPDDSHRRATPGWLQRHRRLAIAVPLVAVLLGLVAVVLASGGGDGASSRSLSELIPASVRSSCKPARDDPWLIEGHHALEQRDCSELTYGRFRTVGAARRFVEADSVQGLDEGSKCPNGTSAQLEDQYEGGHAMCYQKESQAVVINWSYREDPVGVQLFVPGSSVDAALDRRAEALADQPG